MQLDRQRAPGAVRCYRFGELVVDMQQRRLFVGGRERRLSRRAFDLLAVLCRAPRRAIARDELHEALWPGGQVVSDEALTQAVFRLRAVLGPEADRIVTLRGVGIRFDADVDTDFGVGPIEADATPEVPGAAATDTPAGQAATPTRPSVPAARVRGWRVGVLTMAAVIALATFSAFRHYRAEAIVDAGYALLVNDVHAARADTVRLLAEAVRHDNAGDRPRARAVLEALHESDERTPWPALMLGMWAVGQGDPHAAADWLERSRARAAPLRDPYLATMLRYAEAEQAGSPEDIIRHAGAVLDLRPGAWRMRLARAHLLHYQGMREPALAEIARIDVRALGDRKLEAALADRAAYGDVEGAQAALERVPRSTDAAAWHYLAGRLAWTRGDGTAARAEWAQAVEQARRGGRKDIAARARADMGVAAMLAGERTTAISLLEAARVSMDEARWSKDEADVTLVLAQLHALGGDAAKAVAEFRRARDAVRAGAGAAMMATHVSLVGARLFPDALPGFTPPPDPAADALRAARGAWRRGDLDAARAAWQTAVQRGALERTLADETRLLAAELGLPVAPERAFDPPYAPRAGVAARLFLPGASIASD